MEENRDEELNFMGNDPGAVKYGNFINYYLFHSATQRMENVNQVMFPASITESSIVCLDTGCNTGELTKELYKYLRDTYPNSSIHILGVDIDPKLIERATESNLDTNISFRTTNIMNNLERHIIQDYLDSHKKDKFDFVFCFSVTMWIHLNNGDDGLISFLNYLKNVSRTIIIEPQPWNCYRNAQRRVKKSGSTFPLYPTLKINSDIVNTIETILSKGNHKKIYESCNSRWKRKILSFSLL